MIELDNKYYDIFFNSMNEAQKVLYENGVFIPEQIYTKYQRIFIEVQAMFRRFEQRADAYAKGILELSERLTPDDIERYSAISIELEELNICLRKYLTTLSVVD